MDERFGKPWNGNVTFHADRLDVPLRTRKPTVFAIWSDLYHEAITNGQIEQAFDVMLEAKHHTFLIVTKRHERPAGVCTSLLVPDNVYHLVTVENQEMADERIPHALKIPGKVGLLVEPMISKITVPAELIARFSCILAGFETGTNRRAGDINWLRSLRDQCHMAGVPFFLKHIDKKHGRIFDEQEYNELPWGNK